MNIRVLYREQCWLKFKIGAHILTTYRPPQDLLFNLAHDSIPFWNFQHFLAAMFLSILFATLQMNCWVVIARDWWWPTFSIHPMEVQLQGYILHTKITRYWSTANRISHRESAYGNKNSAIFYGRLNLLVQLRVRTSQEPNFSFCYCPERKTHSSTCLNKTVGS